MSNYFTTPWVTARFSSKESILESIFTCSICVVLQIFLFTCWWIKKVWLDLRPSFSIKMHITWVNSRFSAKNFASCVTEKRKQGAKWPMNFEIPKSTRVWLVQVVRNICGLYEKLCWQYSWWVRWGLGW